MNTKLFSIVPFNFFVPLTSKYRDQYVDCILLLFNTYKTEFSYGNLDREIAVKILINYFDQTNMEIEFEEGDAIPRNSRDKANGVLKMLKDCGWIDYEQQLNRQVNIVLFDYALPFIEGMNQVIKEDETEYQGIISQIHATLRTEELYAKPYGMVLKGVKENTDHLLSELKKLDANIKRYIDKQISGFDINELLSVYTNYQEKIGSKSYKRLKTSENISRFRNSIVENLQAILDSSDKLDTAILDYMEVEQESDEDLARSKVVQIIKTVIDAFKNLSTIEHSIDEKNSRCIKNISQKVQMELASGSNTEDKLNAILKYYSKDLKESSDEFGEPCWDELQSAISLFPQNYISEESLRAIPEHKTNLEISKLSEDGMTEIERQKRIIALKERNKNRFTKKNINEYVDRLLKEKDELTVKDFPLKTKRDVLRLIYIKLYSKSKSMCYGTKDLEEKIYEGEFVVPDFVVRRK